ncbi:MAG: sigma-E factor negative regulatory protein [Pseudomonadota bacterium]|nr:sigma-E factor negative regulatory protein [Pseudomonadota bacterium]
MPDKAAHQTGSERQVGDDLSAGMDGELAPTEQRFFCRRLIRDEYSRKQFERYHLIGDVIRNSLPERVNPDLSASIMRAIENESHVPSRELSWVSMASGFAVAASLVAVTFFVTLQSGTSITPEPVVAPLGPVAVVETTPSETPPAVPTTVAAQVPAVETQPEEAVVADAGNRLQRARERMDERLDRLLASHNEGLVDAGQLGMLPYVRVVDSRYELTAASAR